MLSLLENRIEKRIFHSLLSTVLRLSVLSQCPTINKIDGAENGNHIDDEKFKEINGKFDIIVSFL